MKGYFRTPVQVPGSSSWVSPDVTWWNILWCFILNSLLFRYRSCSFTPLGRKCLSFLKWKRKSDGCYDYCSRPCRDRRMSPLSSSLSSSPSSTESSSLIYPSSDSYSNCPSTVDASLPTMEKLQYNYHSYVVSFNNYGVILLKQRKYQQAKHTPSMKRLSSSKWY